jgi:hypothetical protein
VKQILEVCCTGSLPTLVFYGSVQCGLQTFASDVDARILSDDGSLPQRLYTLMAGTVATEASLREGDRVCDF